MGEIHYSNIAYQGDTLQQYSLSGGYNTIIWFIRGIHYTNKVYQGDPLQ